MLPCNKLGLLRRGGVANRSRVSPPPFLCLRSRLPPFLSPGPEFRHRGREEGTLLQVTRAVHLGVERESPVLQSRSGGPEGKSSVTLRIIPRSFTPFSLPCLYSVLLSRCEFANLLSDILRFLPFFIVFRPRELSLSTACVHARVS